VLGGLWSRLTKHRHDDAEERADELQQMSPEERAFVEQSVENRQADLEAEAHLGGTDPNRLLGE
jgi:ATP/maltotriose-dependent transcriptional regulator MalT